MNNTKSQNGNLHPLTLLVKKNKKISEKSGLTSEREKTGGVGMAFAWEAANRGCPGGFKEGSKAQKSYYLRTKHTIFRKYENSRLHVYPWKERRPGGLPAWKLEEGEQRDS